MAEGRRRSKIRERALFLRREEKSPRSPPVGGHYSSIPFIGQGEQIT
jgi:hypothetical protein